MKTATLAALLVVVGCSHSHRTPVPDAQPTADNTPPPLTEADIVNLQPEARDDEIVAVIPVEEAVVPAALDHLRQVVDVTMQTEPRLDGEQVARKALNAIADALAALPQPDMLSIDTIRTDAAMIRKSQGRSTRDGRLLRFALDQSVAHLRAIQNGVEQGDTDGAAQAVHSVSTKRSITAQETVVREALCAVANAVSVEADTGRYGCIEHTLGTASRDH